MEKNIKPKANDAIWLCDSLTKGAGGKEEYFVLKKVGWKSQSKSDQHRAGRHVT